ncbi:MAG: cation diffusion facilitator family transporter, partial [Coriobacteriales bacterium]|nr:cation diffusion facilitator family transporter [Coriobacteriales bacterium]
MAENRERTIVRTSIIGIATNFTLAAFKAFVGIVSHSIAITLDAVNNLSDAMSSVVTIIGAKYANKAPDRKHPLGHGRAEFLSALVVSVIVLYAGLTSLVESIKAIITPEVPDYAPASLIVVAVAVLVKIVLGLYVKRVGKQVNSDSLVDSGQDALLDSIISASTLVAAGIYLGTGKGVEAWLASIISLVIIKSGVDMLLDTVSQILGQRVDSELAGEVKAAVTQVDGVLGAYDLILHSYGPDRWQGSVHVEVPGSMTALEIDALERKIQRTVFEQLGVILTGIGIYAVNEDDKALAMRTRVREIVMSKEHALQMHGFFVDEKKKRIRFDTVVDFDAEDRQAVCDEIA